MREGSAVRKVSGLPTAEALFEWADAEGLVLLLE